MEFLYILEKIRIPILNECMLFITRLGEETAFLALALILFWCVDKRRGYYLLTVGFMGNMINHVLKLTFRVPRPWVLDPNFTILEQAREASTGYSFPSGHSQTAVGTFGSIAVTSRNKWVKWICIAAAILVPVSRMYIGVHTPADVLTASAYSLVLVLALRPVSQERGGRYLKWLIPLMFAMAVGSMIYFNQLLHLDSLDSHNMESAMKNAYTMLGCVLGIAVVYYVDNRFLQFKTEGSWKTQILKIFLGLGLVLLVKEGLRLPLELVFSKYIARSVRYFLIVVTAGILWPMTFPWFQKLGDKNELRNHKKL